MASDSAIVKTLNTTGEFEDNINVIVGPRFLELFSKNLYSSPNKAFEELISNSWDAGATAVYVHIPTSLQDSDPIWVLDNGESMDFAGLKLLWTVTSDHKRKTTAPPRPQIGKFGIGKLATYILASEVTYICKGGDGVIRSVSMNYGVIEEMPPENFKLTDLPLQVRRLKPEECTTLLADLPSGPEIVGLITKDVPKPADIVEGEAEEYGFNEEPPSPSKGTPGTWTLVLLTSLKDYGTSLQAGRIRWLLRTALPLGNSLGLVLNGETLQSTKISNDIETEWQLGTNLGIKDVDYPDGETTIVTENAGSHPHVLLPGIDGPITGKAVLYKEKLTGAKSDLLGASNGFFINILGRVINIDNGDFGLDNLSHGAWANFRATIRADGIDQYLNVERAGLRDCQEVELFKAFLRAVFNKARTAYNSAEVAAWPSPGDVLAKSWDVVPLRALGDVVSERLGTSVALPDIIDTSGVTDVNTVRAEWMELTKNHPGDLIEEVRAVQSEQSDPISKYDLATRKLLLNESHPFFRDRTTSPEGRALLQEMALVDFLTEMHLTEIGADSSLLSEGRRFKDQLYRLLSQLRRMSGAQIAEILVKSTTHADGFEVAIGDALDYLGFSVTRLGGSGEPEGVAKAPLTSIHDPRDPAQLSAKTITYALSYDAKSTSKENGRVTNKDVGAGRLARHRVKFSADYSLVVAPDFELGALQNECSTAIVTPMRANDLARLLISKATTGVFDFAGFQQLFELHDPDHVREQIDSFLAKESARPHLTMGDFLAAIESIGFEAPDIITVEVVADRIRNQTGNKQWPTATEVRNVIQGISVLLPSIVRIQSSYVYLSASAKAIREALIEQLKRLPEELKSQAAAAAIGEG